VIPCPRHDAKLQPVMEVHFSSSALFGKLEYTIAIIILFHSGQEWWRLTGLQLWINKTIWRSRPRS